MQFTHCPHPACGALAEIIDRFVFPSTHGFIEHVKVLCLHRHWFMLPVDKLPVSATSPGYSGRSGTQDPARWMPS